MAQTVISGKQVKDSTIQRVDLDTSTVGQAVVTKIVQGSGITLSSTGADSGTGDVTVSSPDVVSTDAGNIATLGTDNHILVPQSQIWSVRLRSFNAAGNPTFEVDQRNVGNSVANPANATFVIDRWGINKVGTMTFNMQQNAAFVLLPGTNFTISRCFLRITLTGQETTLGASDWFGLYQFVEGPQFRELCQDVHSCQVLVRSSVAPLKFGVSISDSAQTQIITKLCTISTANTWALLPMPNMSVFPAGNFSTGPGTAGQMLHIILGAGSSVTNSSNDVWVASTSAIGALGQDNFASKPITTSTFDIAFVQWEPGAQCTTPIDCPFGQNLDGDMGCLRYFQKSQDYAVKPGGGAGNTFATFTSATAMSSAAFTAYGGVRFPKLMAKTPTCVAYNSSTQTANSAHIYFASSGGVPTGVSELTVSGVGACQGGINSLSFANGTSTSQVWAYADWTADTGW